MAGGSGFARREQPVIISLEDLSAPCNSFVQLSSHKLIVICLEERTPAQLFMTIDLSCVLNVDERKDWSRKVIIVNTDRYK